MPEAADIPAVQTALQSEIAAKTAAAVQDTGFGKEFDLEVEAAIAKDAGIAPKPPEPTPDKPPPKPEPKPKAEPVADIPESLLTKKAKAEPKEGDTDPDREKFIKEQTAGLSTKAADRFRALEAKAHAAEQKAAKAAKLEQELAAAQERLKSTSDNSALEELRKEKEALDEIVQKQALADHPRFKAHYDAKIAQEISIASKIAPKEASAEVEALLSLPETAQRNRRLNEIIAELEPLEASKFQAAVDRADRLNSEKQGELANWKANKSKLAELTQQEQEQAIAHRKSSIEKALKAVIPRVTDENDGIELFRKDEGNTEWNAKVDDRLEKMRKLTETDLSPEDKAQMAAWAISGAEYRKLFLTQRVLVRRLQEEIAALKGGEPQLGEGGGSGGAVNDKEDTIDAIVRIAQQTGAVR